MADAPLLKDFYNEALVRKISTALYGVWPEFDQDKFVDGVIQQFEPLSLTERAWAITEAMRSTLPEEYPKVASIFTKSFGPEQHLDRMEGMDGFYYLPFGNFVAKYGLDHFDISIDLLLEITKRFTSEFPIRPFIVKYPEQTMVKLNEWTCHENVHVRRLVSEGTRTRLPWASRLPQFVEDPTPVLELLEKLKADPELYVRRSVANNLNDIGKDHPDVVVEVLTRWSRTNDPGTQWIIKHASRSLVKAGNTGALALLGYNPNADVELKDFKVSAEVQFGKDLQFSGELTLGSEKTENLMVDFVVHYMKANGKLAPKVFKLAKLKMKPGDTVDLRKQVPFKPINTRKYYPGTHALELQINGKRHGYAEFELHMP